MPNPPLPGHSNEQFDHMGQSYIESLRAFPEAREEEWLMLQTKLGRGAGPFLDYACGDGFVTARLSSLLPDSDIVGVDSSATMLREYRARFLHHSRIVGMTVDEFEAAPHKNFGLVLCLGGFHHVMDQVGRLSSLRHRIGAAGRIIIADFLDGSPSQVYFDELINSYNPTGHIGLFLSRSRAANLARACGLKLVDCRQAKVGWHFSTREAIPRFVIQHHGLSCPPEVVQDFLNPLNLIQPHAQGWQLTHTYCLAEYTLQ